MCSVFTVTILGLMFAASPAFSAPPPVSPPQSASPIPLGELIEKVVCAEKPEQSYALYVPTKYTRDKSSPILLALDPGARGKNAVEHFKEAGEKYGWIIAASNNSRNGPLQPSIDAVNAVWRDARTRLAIDDRRVYFAGFSGAARAAMRIADACGNCARGVIIGGAGFPPGTAAPTTIRFPIFATIGIDDFNFPEVKNLDDLLTKAGVEHQVSMFSGGHDWPPAQVLVEAVEWMELQALRAGVRARDAKFIDELWQKQTTRAEDLERANQPYEAYQTYAAMANAFKSLRDLAEIEKRIVVLVASREVKEAQRNEQQQIKKQRDLESQVQRLLSTLNTARETIGGANDPMASPEDNSMTSDSRVRSIFADLRKAADSPQDSSERRVARRVLGGLYVGFFEQGLNLLEQQNRFAVAARIFELVTAVAPERPGGYYFLAAAYALNRDKKKSLQALKTAIDKGFTDAEALKNNKAFDSIRSEPAYQELIKRLSGGR